MIGHDWAVTFLKRHVGSGAVRHAYLITGADGLGKKPLAIRFARSLNCETGLDLCEWNAKNEVELERCHPCSQIERLAYPDLHLVRPETVGGHIVVKQIRALERQLHLKPYDGRWRTALLFDFHQATNSASNALLKTLEEPPVSVVLVLTAPTKESLLPTIASRCEVIHLRPVSRQIIRDALETRGAPRELASELAEMSAGLPGQALRLWQNSELQEERKRWLDDLITLLQSDMTTRFAYASRMTEQRDSRWSCKQGLELWLGFSRDTMLIAHQAQIDRVTPDYSDSIEKLARLVKAEQLRAFVRNIDQAINAIDHNANPRLTVEGLMLDMPLARELL